VRNLALFNGVIIVALAAYAYFLKMPFDEIIPLILTALLASILSRFLPHLLSHRTGATALAKLDVLPRDSLQWMKQPQ